MGLLLYALSSFLIPLARGPLVVSGVFLASQQLFDFGLAVCEKTEFSLRQSIVSNRMLGRVNASMTVDGSRRALAAVVPGPRGKVGLSPDSHRRRFRVLGTSPVPRHCVHV